MEEISELLTNATVVDEAIRFVSAHRIHRASAPRWKRRTGAGCRPRCRRRWPGRSAGSCRWASGPPPGPGRWPASPRLRRSPGAARSRTVRGPVRRPPRRRPAGGGGCAYSTSRTRVLLPLPLTPVTQVSRPRGTRHRALQVVQPRVPARGGRCRLRDAAGRARPSRCFSGCFRNRPVREARLRMIAATRALRHDVAAVHPAARAEVHDVLRPADGLLVVLDHDDGVALCAQGVQRVQEHEVVPGVQADGRLVQDVADPAQVRAELGGQADALRLSAAQRGRGAVQRQVGEADALEEREPGEDLGDDVARDLRLPRRETEGLHLPLDIPPRAAARSRRCSCRGTARQAPPAAGARRRRPGRSFPARPTSRSTRSPRRSARRRIPRAAAPVP